MYINIKRFFYSVCFAIIIYLSIFLAPRYLWGFEYREDWGVFTKGMIYNYGVQYKHGVLIYKKTLGYTLNEEIYEVKLSRADFKELKAIVNQYKLEDDYSKKRKIGGDSKKEQSNGIIKRGCFYSYNTNAQYIGLTDIEKRHKTDYHMQVKINGWSTGYRYREEIPENSNDIVEKMWDFTFKHINTQDFRKDLNKVGYERMINAYPFMADNVGTPDIEKLVFFSLNEFFGGLDSGINSTVSFNTNGYVDAYMEYSSISKELTYYVDNNGEIQLLQIVSPDTAAIINKTMNHYSRLIIDEDALIELKAILTKYDLTGWVDHKENSNSVNEGLFFDFEQAEHNKTISQSEKKIRQSYQSFIYLYDSEGKKFRISLQNSSLPDNYNDLRKEIWNFVMKYIDNESLDWRKNLNDTGEKYLQIKGV